MNFDSFPEKRIVPPFQSEKVTLRKYDWMMHLLKGQFDDIDPEKRPTALDFQGLRPDSKEEDFLSWIERELGIKKELILDNNESQESKNAYLVLNYAYQQAKDFLKNTLKYREEEISIGPHSISSKSDIFNLLRKTFLISGQNGLGRSLLYCRIVKATLATYENLKNDAEALEEATTAFENSMIAPPSLVHSKGAPLVHIKDSEKGKKFYSATHGGVKGYIESRAKRIEKAILKFLTRAESNAQTALKDGIASRITIEKEQAIELLPILAKWLTEEMKVDFIKIEDQEFLSKDQKEKVEELLLSVISQDKFSLEENAPNKTSVGVLENIKITGVLQPIEKGSRFITLAKPARQFEIVIEAFNNKNEKGAKNHEIYDVVKFVTARTRLDGGCPESVFYEFVKDASQKSGISESKIIYYLTETENAPILKMKKANGKRKEYYYLAHSVYSRWNGFGWVDKELYSEIEAERERNSS